MVSHSQNIDISKLATIALASKPEGIDARLNTLDFTWDTDGIRAEGTFCYLTFRDGQITQDEFLQFICAKAIPYCLPREYLKKCLEKLIETGNERWIFEPYQRTKELFIKAKEKNKRTGEPGEVILFTLLEGLLNAPRIVSKMYLKTNSNMEIYGSDAIHIKYNPIDEVLNIYWGESKLYSSLPTALDKIIESIQQFLKYDEEKGESQKAFDINLIKKFPDIDGIERESTIKALESYLDPYDVHYNKTREIHACLAVWDWDFYQTVLSKDRDKIEELFREKYLERITSACSLFINKVKHSSLKNCRFQFFLLPVRDNYSFRKQFCSEMGLPIPSKED